MRAFLLVGTLASAFYLVIGRRLWFTNDEWDLLANRTAGNFGDLFRSHNSHWSTLPIIVYRLLWWGFGIRTYVPYQALIVALHLLAAWLVRAVMRRAGVGSWTATATATALVLFGRGEQDIIWAYQIAYVSSLVLGLTHLLLADHEGPLDRRDWLGLAAGTAGMLCSNIAVPMVIVVGIATLIRRGWRIAAVHTVPLGLLYLTWWSTIARGAHSAYTSAGTTWSQRARFVVTTPLNALRSMTSFRGGQWLVVALLVVGLFIAWRRCTWADWSARYAAPVALLIGTGAFLAITALGRAGPTGAAQRSRYLDIALAMMLPALGVAADAVIRRRRAFVIPVFVLLLIGIPSNVRAIAAITDAQARGTDQFRRTVLALPRDPLSRDVPRALRPVPGITIGWLLDGVASGRIPAPDAVRPDEAATNELLLSLRKSNARGPVRTPCRTLTAPIIVHLRTNDSLRVERGVIRIVPATGPFEDTYPAIYKTGIVLTPVVPEVTFRVLPASASRATSVCGPRRR